MRGMPDHQFPLAGLDSAPDLGTVPEDLDGFEHFIDAARNVLVELRKMVEESIEVLQDLGGQLDAGHACRQRLSWRAAGLRGRSPRARAAT